MGRRAWKVLGVLAVLVVVAVVGLVDIPRVYGGLTVHFMVVPPAFLLGDGPIERVASPAAMVEMVEARQPGCRVEVVRTWDESAESRSLMDRYPIRVLELGLRSSGSSGCDARGRWRIRVWELDRVWELGMVEQAQPPIWGGLVFAGAAES